jgi:hypothetical protein
VKKIVALVAVVTLALFSTSALAQRHHHGLTATSDPVQLKAIVPEYIGLTPINTAPVVFNFKHLSDADKDAFVSGGYVNNLTGSSAPTWNLKYNLKHRTVTVCAYATDLTNAAKTEAGSTIASYLILGVPTQFTQGNGRWFSPNAGCTANMGTGSIVMDVIPDATSTFNTGNPTGILEGFSLMQIAGNGSDWHTKNAVPAPGIYLGVMYVVAQAL